MSSALVHGNGDTCSIPFGATTRQGFDTRRTRAALGHARLDDQQIVAHRDYLLSYAQRSLRDPHLAEDAVQEALLAAVLAKGGFAAQSSIRTWLTSILKHKIADAQRRTCRMPLLIDPYSDDDADAATDLYSVFDLRGYWGSDAARPGGHPELDLERREFWRLCHACINSLPRRTALAFAMRDLIGSDIADICQALDISPKPLLGARTPGTRRASRDARETLE